MGALFTAIVQDHYVVSLIALMGSVLLGVTWGVLKLLSWASGLDLINLVVGLGATFLAVRVYTQLKLAYSKSSKDDEKTFQAQEFEDSEDGEIDLGPNGEAGSKLLLTTMEFYLRQVGSPTMATIHRLNPKKNDVIDSDPMGEVVNFLTSRAQSILEHNPWLTGRFKTKVPQEQDPQLKSLYLWVPDKVPSLSGANIKDDDSDIKRFYRVIKVSTVEEVTNWDKGLKLSAPNAYTCANADISPARVTLIHHSSPETGICTFALVLSLNHVLGDAATDYNVLSMFSGDVEVRALVAKRERHWSKLPKTLLGEDAQRKTWWWILSSRNGPVQQLLTRKNNRSNLISMQEKLFDAESRGEPYPKEFRHYAYAYSVDPVWIEEQKRLFKRQTSTLEKHDALLVEKNAPFLSTNDILCSWIYSNVKPEIAAGFMVYDMRGRQAGITTDHAGNYGEILGFFPEDFHEPANIRTSVASGGTLNDARFSKLQHTKPGPGRSTASITNWGQFYRTVKPHPTVESKLLTPGQQRWLVMNEATHLDTLSLVASINKNEVGTPLPLCTIWRRNDEGSIGVFLTCEEPLSLRWCPKTNPGKTPFKEELHYKVPELVASGVHVNIFR